MATYSYEATKKVRHSWFVPSADPWGAAIAEFSKALSACEAKAKLEQIDTRWDNWCHVSAKDDQIEIWFEIEERNIG